MRRLSPQSHYNSDDDYNASHNYDAKNVFKVFSFGIHAFTTNELQQEKQ
jgi:hypothetical protein